jgi:Tol biopolymer transport system component
VLDFIGHGTHVSGTIAAVGNNGLGVIGVAWQAHIMTESIFTGLGETTAEWVAAALRYAADNGADVVNMSFGGYGDALLVRDTADYAAAHGVVLVAAAGNDAIEVPVSPASLEPVIAVAAVDHLDEPAWFSNSGGKIELAAPGGGDSRPPRYEPYASVLSVNEGGCPAPPYACVVDPQLLISSSAGGLQLQFLRLGGTSMAAPHVSGVAALILSRHPEFTVEQVRQALRNGADDLGPAGRDARYGSGRLNAARSVALDAVAVARLTAPKHLSRLHGELITVEGTVQNPGGGTPSWQLLFGPQGQTLSVIASGTGELDHQTLATLDTGPLDRGNYTLELDVVGPNGATASDNLTFTRLATRPYIRQLTNQTGQPWLTSDAWSADGRTLAWSDMPHFASYRILTTDLPTGAERALAEFQYGWDDPQSTYPPMETVISRDGSTVAFVAREDLSPSNFSVDPNFVLFLLDTASGALQALTPPAGFGDLGRLAIAADGSRITLVSDLGLDPGFTPNGYLQVFYWDRASNAFHQLTTFGQQVGVAGNVAITLDGQRLAFVSNADLDPSVGNADGGWQVFTYDIPSGAMHQLTTYPPSPIPPGGGSQQQLGSQVAFSPDGGTLAVTRNAVVWGQASPGVVPVSVQEAILFIDIASGTATPVVERAAVPMPPWETGYWDSGATFSFEGTKLFFAGLSPADPIFPPLALKDRRYGAVPSYRLFRYDIAAQSLEQLGPAPAWLAPAPGGRVAFLTDFGAASPFTRTELDPEGMNPDESTEIYLLDADAGGGFLWLQHGRLRQSTSHGDSFSLSGRFVQLAGAMPDPAANAVSVTVLSANGQIFRATVAAGSMYGGEGHWRYSNSSAPGLTHLRLSTKDSIHYTFRAAGRGTGLFSAATPYITVEIEVGDAVFSNAQRFHYSGPRLAYP